MAIVRLLSKKQPVADFAVSCALVTVRDLTVDCAPLYEAGTRSVEIRSDGAGNTVIGGKGCYLAIIDIPGQRFVDGENGPELLPLDPAAIAITLWPSA